MPERSKYCLTPLPYAYDALAPAISKECLSIHHERILQGHIDALNILLDGEPVYLGMSPETLLSSYLPRRIREEALWHASAVYAHELYFASMSKKQDGCPVPSGVLALALARDIGSYGTLCYSLIEAAGRIAVGGFLYLVRDRRDGRLSVMEKEGYSLPDLRRVQPIMAIDLWEHAYFSDYGDSRRDAVRAFLSVAAWDHIQ